MPFKRTMKGLPSDVLAATGYLGHDWPALTVCQRQCITRMGMTIQAEQEAYMSEHPEIKALLEICIGKHSQPVRKKNLIKETLEFFTRSFADIDEEIRDRLGIRPHGLYTQGKTPPFKFNDIELENDLKKIITDHYPPETWILSPSEVSTPNTMSSSFLSINTSDTTLPTPEPIPTPQPTLSENMFAMISNTVDKAIFSQVDDAALRYDFAYVELSHAVDEAMEIPVVEIREDIVNIFYSAFRFFELIIMEKERIAAEIAWEKRMRKKMKRSLRRMDNFKGYETPPTPKSTVSSHESFKKPPPRPCVCHPQYHYNRYPKDRFGIYLPQEIAFNNNNTTATPAISVESITTDPDSEKTDGKPPKTKSEVVKTTKIKIKN